MRGTRVLHVLRHDHATHLGGDLVELQTAVAASQVHRVDAVAATAEDARGDFDVVVLYNLALPRQLRTDLGVARRRWPRARVLVVPIFWTYRLGDVARSRDPALLELAARRTARTVTTWRVLRRILLDADRVITKTRAEAALLERVYRVGGRLRVAVVAPGIDTRLWCGARRERDVVGRYGVDTTVRTVVAAVGRLEPNKNQRAVVRAAAELGDAAVVLVGPAGDQRYADAVASEGADLLPGRFACTGRLAPAEVAEVLAATDVHALPSHLEVASTAMLEAAAAGCEVVATPTAASRELLGELVRPCRPDGPGVAAAIHAARTEPAQPALGEAARRFDLDRLGAAWAEVLGGLTS